MVRLTRDPSIATYPENYGRVVRMTPRCWLRLEQLRTWRLSNRKLSAPESRELAELENAWFDEQWPRWRRPSDRPERRG